MDARADELAQLVERIVGVGCRYVGEPGEIAVRELAFRELVARGLQPRSEELDVATYVPGSASCRLVGDDLALPCAGLQWTAAGAVEAEAVYLGRPANADAVRAAAARHELAGRIAVIHGPWPFAVVPALVEERVVGVVVISEARDGRLAHYIAQLYPRPEPRTPADALPVPGVVVEHEAGVALVGRLAAAPGSRIRIEHDAGYRVVASSNVVARVAGTGRSAEHVILAAHCDAQIEGDGAWDNGTGLAALIAIAGRVAARPPVRDVVFVVTTDEEQGLSGAVSYCRRHRDELDDAVAMLNLDALAWLAGGTIALHVDPALERYAVARLDEIGWRPELIVETSTVVGADHNPFVDAGVPSAWLWRQQPMHPYYHSTGDTAALIDFAAVSANADAIEHLARSLADDTGLRLGRSRPARRWVDYS